MARVFGVKKDPGPEKCFPPSLAANVLPQATVKVAPVSCAGLCSKEVFSPVTVIPEQLFCVSCR